MNRDARGAGRAVLLGQWMMICRRLLSGILLLLGLSLACFAFIDLAPGDFLTDTAMNSQLSRDAVEQLRDRTGLDVPFWKRYASWIRGLLRGQLGPSFSYGIDASELLLPRLGRTALLNGSAILLALLLSLYP